MMSQPRGTVLNMLHDISLSNGRWMDTIGDPNYVLYIIYHDCKANSERKMANQEAFSTGQNREIHRSLVPANCVS